LTRRGEQNWEEICWDFMAKSSLSVSFVSPT
jgi:hypothetical protein